MAASTGRDDDGPRRDREDIHPDYARGQDQEENHTDAPDFARGQRQDGVGHHEGSFAEGQAHPEQYVETTDHEDFAHGQRRGDQDRR